VHKCRVTGDTEELWGITCGRRKTYLTWSFTSATVSIPQQSSERNKPRATDERKLRRGKRQVAGNRVGSTRGAQATTGPTASAQASVSRSNQRAQAPTEAEGVLAKRRWNGRKAGTALRKNGLRPQAPKTELARQLSGRRASEWIERQGNTRHFGLGGCNPYRRPRSTWHWVRPNLRARGLHLFSGRMGAMDSRGQRRTAHTDTRPSKRLLTHPARRQTAVMIARRQHPDGTGPLVFG
jgi:hypothetical protein